MKILVRLPNWVGDVIMSLRFVDGLKKIYPDADISFIVKSGLENLLDLFPVNAGRYVFSKEEYPGFMGPWKFGRIIAKSERIDLFFCLPESFSSGMMGFASGARKRIGYRKEFRSWMFTHTFAKSKARHRSEQFLDLLRKYTGQQLPAEPVFLTMNSPKDDTIVVNINSEASSRKLPIHTAVTIISEVRQSFPGKIFLVGSKRDQPYVTQVFDLLPDKKDLENLSGQTTLIDLASLMAAAKVVLTTDSGPAHVANAVGAPTVVINGAGDERNTAPFNPGKLRIVRLGKLSCEPCVKNVCLLYGLPKCLELLDPKVIVSEMSSIANEPVLRQS